MGWILIKLTCLFQYTRQDIDWYGLTYEEAVDKYLRETKYSVEPVPLKHKYRSELIAKLKQANIAEAVDADVEVPG